MRLLDRYRRLSFREKLGVWGSIASLAGLAIAIGSLDLVKKQAAERVGKRAEKTSPGSDTMARSPDPSAPIREISAREVLAHLQSLPPLQRQQVESTAYVRRRVRWRGRVLNVRQTTSGFLLALSEEDGQTPLTLVNFKSSWRATLEGLRRGDIVAFEGSIAAFDAGSIIVDGAALSLPKVP